MTAIELNVDPPDVGNWGEFAIRKSYTVKKEGKQKGVFGYIVQKVEKETRVDVEGQELTTTQEILDFTSNMVNHATKTYYEVFPILNGNACLRKLCVDDKFQNGALLKYEEDQGVMYANDEPSTSGTITMVGTNIFKETTQKVAKEIYNAIVQKDKSIVIDGKYWDLTEATPANGLPFSEEYDMPEGGVVHRVRVTWDKKGATTVESSPPLAGGRRRRLTRGRTASKLRYTRRTGRTRRR